MESTAVGILRKEMESSGGNAPMSSLSVRVKWGQNDLAQLGNFRKFLMKYPEVFKLDGNTVHLANASPTTPKAPVAQATVAAVPQTGANQATPPSTTPPTTGVSKATSDVKVGAPTLIPAPPKAGSKRILGEGSSDGPETKAARKAPTMAPYADSVLAFNSKAKAGMAEVEGGSIGSSAVTKLEDGDAYTPKEGGTPEVGSHGGKGSPGSKEGGEAPSKAGSNPKSATLDSGFGPSAKNSFAAAKPSGALRAPSQSKAAVANNTPMKGKSWGPVAPSKSASVPAPETEEFHPNAEPSNPLVHQKGTFATLTPSPPTVPPPSKGVSKGMFKSPPKAPPMPELGDNDEMTDDMVVDKAEDVMGSTTFVPKGGISKGIAAPKKQTVAPPAPPMPHRSAVSKQAAGLARVQHGQPPPSKNGKWWDGATSSQAAPWRARGKGVDEVGSACDQDHEADDMEAPVDHSQYSTPHPSTRNSLMGKMAPLKGQGKGDMASLKGEGKGDGKGERKLSSEASPSTYQALSKSVVAKPPEAKHAASLQFSLEPKAALIASQAKRPSPQMALPKQHLSAFSTEFDGTTHAELPVQQPWEEDLSNEELSKVILGCKAYGVDLELVALAKKLLPSEEYNRTCQQYIQVLKSTVTTLWGSREGVLPPLVEVCGAHAQGTEIDGGDLDIALQFAPGLSHEERDSFIKELREKLHDPSTSSFLTVSDSKQLFPHATAPMTLELKDACPRALAHLLLTNQPIHPNETPLTVDGVIKQLCDTFELSRDFLRLVKLWAVNHALSNQHEGYMNGVAWALLAIFFLQKERLVPPFAALSHGALPPTSARPQLSTLFRGFFEFLVARDGSAQRGLSVIHAQEYRAPSGVLFLEDPAEFHETRQQQNLAETVGETQWSRILEEARKAVERLTPRPQRWFHWAEVFDPRELPPDKITRLKPMSQTVAPAVASSVGSATPETKVSGLAPMTAASGVGCKGNIATPHSAASTTVPRPGSGKGPGPPGSRGLGSPHQGLAGRGKGPVGYGFGRF